MITHVTDSTFELEVLNSDKPVLVDFWAVWCGPCKMVAPVVEQIAEKYEGKLKVAKLDVDKNPKISMGYGITSIPTLILFDKGKPAAKLIGFRPAEQIEESIKGFIE